MDLTRRQLVSKSVVAGLGAAVAGSLTNRARAHDATAPQLRVPTPEAPLRVQVALFDGFEVIDALGPYDALSIASKLGGALATTLVTLNGEAEVVALDNVHVKPNAPFDPNADVLIVPGAPALWRGGGVPAGLTEAFTAFRQPGKLLATVCTGAVFAARAGLMTGRNVNTHKAAQTLLTELGAVLQQARVVDDGDLWSSSGVTAGIDLAIYLVESYFGAKVAMEVERVIEYERRGVVWRA